VKLAAIPHSLPSAWITSKQYLTLLFSRQFGAR